MRQPIFDLAFEGDQFIFAVDCALALFYIVLVAALVAEAVAVFEDALAVFHAVLELAFVDAFRGEECALACELFVLVEISLIGILVVDQDLTTA